jgi:hypothetical protein
MMSTRSQAVLALTLAAGPLLIANTAHAASATCGQPAKAAVYETVHHDAEDVVVGQLKVVDEPAHPAVPAVFTKESYVVTPAVEAVPEVTSTESEWTLSNTAGPAGEGWALTGQTKSHDAVTQVRTQWTKVTQTTEYEWVLKVVDQAASTTVVHHDAVYRTDTVPATYQDVVVPATYQDVVVPATYKDVVDVPAHVVHHDAVYDTNLFAYVNKQGKTRYETVGWNVLDEHDQGWTLVSPAQHPIVTPAWDENVATTYKSVVDVPEHTITVVDVAEHTESVVDVPEYTVEVLVTEAWDETVEQPEVSHEEQQWTDSATQAPGYGWERSNAYPRVSTDSDTMYTDGYEQAPEGYDLVDQAVTTITPAYTEYEWARTVVTTPGQAAIPAVMGERDVLVTPEVPATEEVSHLEDLVVTIPAGDETHLVSAAVPAGPACATDPADQTETGGTDPADQAEAGSTDPASPAESAKAASAVPAMLAFTGADTGNYLAGGLVLVFLGAGVIVATRRRQDASS